MFFWGWKFVLASFSPSLKRSLFRVNCNMQKFITNTVHCWFKWVYFEGQVHNHILPGFFLKPPTTLTCRTDQTCCAELRVIICCLFMPPSPHFVTELEAKTVRGFDKREPSYYVRLGSLSTKLRKRAYTRAVARIQDAKQRSREFISELNSTVDLVGPAFILWVALNKRKISTDAILNMKCGQNSAAYQ